MAEIQQVLILYSTTRYFDVNILPSHLLWFRPEKDVKTVANILQQRYHTLHGQECNLLLASNDKAALYRFLMQLRIMICEIEKAVSHYRKRGYFVALPGCLLTCHVQGGNTSLERLQYVYDMIKEMEYKIALQDMGNTYDRSHVQGSTQIGEELLVSFDSGTFSSALDTVNEIDPPPTYL